jgi:hypothetical protein
MKKLFLLFFLILNLSMVFSLTPNFFNKVNYYDQIIDVGVLDNNLSGDFLKITLSDQYETYFEEAFSIKNSKKIDVVFDSSVSSYLVANYEVLDSNYSILETYSFPLFLESIDLGRIFLCDIKECHYSDSKKYFDNSSKIYLNVDNNLDVNYSLDLFLKEGKNYKLLFSESTHVFPYFLAIDDSGSYKLVLSYYFEDLIFTKKTFFEIGSLEPISSDSFSESNIVYSDFVDSNLTEPVINKNTSNDSNTLSEKNYFFQNSKNILALLFISIILILILIILFTSKNKRSRHRKIASFFVVFFIFFNLGSVFAESENVVTLEGSTKLNEIFTYYRTLNAASKDIVFSFEINESLEANDTLLDNYQIIPSDVDDIFREPILDLEYSNRFLDFAEIYSLENRLETVYFFNINKSNSTEYINNSCFENISNYYKSIDFFGQTNIINEQETIRQLFLPRTKPYIESELEKFGDSDFINDCFNFLLTEKILVPYDILLYTKVELKNIPKNFELYMSIETINFEPPFLTTKKPLDILVSFKRTPIVIESSYSMPYNCDKENLSYCYINNSDFDSIKYLSDTGSIASPEFYKRMDDYASYLNNFDLVKDLYRKEVDGVNIKDLLSFAAINRENLCFSNEKREYNELIFDVAKAYNFTDEQALQFWALIAERSNCDINYDDVDNDLLGLAQIDLEAYYNQYIDLHASMHPFLKEEEYLQYLVLGDFKEINEKNIAKFDADKVIRFGGLSSKISNMYWYYEFLIKAIKNSKDKYGSLVLFAGTDYLKEMTTLVNFCEKYYTDNYLENIYYDYESFVTDNLKKNLRSIFVLSSLLDKKEFSFTEEICKYTGEPESIVMEYPIIYTNLTGNYCIDNGFVPSVNYPRYKKIDGVTYHGTGALLYKCEDNKIYSCIPGTEIIQEVSGSAVNILKEELCSRELILKEKRVKISKEFKVLINYLAIKHKYLTNREYFVSNGFLEDSSNDSKKFLENKTNYFKLKYDYFDIKKENFLEITAEKNISLLKRIDPNYYFAEILQNRRSLAYARSGNCAQFVREIGTNLFTSELYPRAGVSAAWLYDTTPTVKERYNLIWESPIVCYSKPGNRKLPRSRCVETPEVQSPTLDLDLLPDGAILGLYVCKQSHGSLRNLEYTHVGTYIGKDQLGHHLFIHMGNSRSIEIISEYTSHICSSGYNRQIMRVYVPKSTGITSMDQLRELKEKDLLQPVTWIKDINEVINRSNGLEYPEFGIQDEEEMDSSEYESDDSESEDADLEENAEQESE